VREVGNIRGGKEGDVSFTGVHKKVRQKGGFRGRGRKENSVVDKGKYPHTRR